MDFSLGRSIKLILLCGVCALMVAGFASSSQKPSSSEGNCVTCHARSSGRASEVVALHALSTHGKAGVGCIGCHGGDPAQADKIKAHSGRFIAKPDAKATLVMCGACHQSQLGQFKSGKHFDARQGEPRVDCAACHGIHSIGNREESFTLTQFCAGCHGLEYLPALPPAFQNLLTMTDELHDEVRLVAAKGRTLTTEEERQRLEIRYLTAGIIHPTNLEGGLQGIPQILQAGAKLKAQLKKTK